MRRRPDLLEKHQFTKEEERMLEGIKLEMRLENENTEEETDS